MNQTLDNPAHELDTRSSINPPMSKYFLHLLMSNEGGG